MSEKHISKRTFSTRNAPPPRLGESTAAPRMDRCEELPKKKRGRPPKALVSSNDPSDVVASLDSEPANEIFAGRKLINDVMNMNKIKFLLDKPDVLLFGLYDYYEIIDQPIWLSEVFRKFNDEEYSRFAEITSDVKLVLENCCRFWGRGHKFIKQALRVEKLMGRHIKELPETLKTEIQNDDGLKSNEMSFKTDEFHSEILEEMERKQWKRTLRVPADVLLAWETEMFESKSSEIRVIPELAEIGQFLSLAKDTLCLKRISQYEVERMLLLSRESITLANVMTSLLCPTALRTILYNKPVMVYEVWSSLLRKKMDTWYHAYAKTRDRIQLYLRYGIETSFWDTLGDVNPFASQPEFDQMPLNKKAVILKALCTVMFHSNKKMEENFNAMDENKLREAVTFEDSKYKYYSMFAPEIRVYRVSKNEDGCVSNEISTKPTSANRSPEKKPAFCLVAWNKKSLAELIRVLSKKKKSLSSMNKLLSEHDGEESTMLALQGMRNQWETTKNNESFVESSINYWWAKTRPNKPQEPPSDVGLTSEGNDGLKDFEVQTFLKRKLEDNENDPPYIGTKNRRSIRHVERLPTFFTNRLERLRLLSNSNKLECPDPNISLRGSKRRLSAWLAQLRPSLNLRPRRKAFDILRAAVERPQTLQPVATTDNVLTVSILSKSSEDSNSNDQLKSDEIHSSGSWQSSSGNVSLSSPGRVLHIPVIENANDLFEGSPAEQTDILCIDTLQKPQPSFRGIEVGE